MKQLSLVFLVVGALLTPSAYAEKTQPVAVGDFPVAAGDFGKDQHDALIKLDALRGQVVVLTFWATWCGPCLNEMNTLGRLSQIPEIKGKLTVIAMNLHEDQDRYRRIRRALAKFPLSIGWASESLSDKYGVHSIPNMFLIGKDGRIADHHVGYDEKNLDAFIDQINELLNAPDPAVNAATTPSS